MQPDLAKVARLGHQALVIEEQPEAVGRVVTLGPDLLMGEKGDIRIGIAKDRNQVLAHGASQPAAVTIPEFHCIGQPSNGVTERAHRNLHQHLAISGRIVMDEGRLARMLDLDAIARVVTPLAADASGTQLRLDQDQSAVQVGQFDLPGTIAFRHRHPETVIEIEPNAVRAMLGWPRRRRWIRALYRPRGRGALRDSPW